MRVVSSVFVTSFPLNVQRVHLFMNISLCAILIISAYIWAFKLEMEYDTM